MPQTDKINSIWDVAAIDAETQAVVISIDKAKAAYLGLNDSINKNKATGLTDLSSNSNLLDTTIQKLNQSINILNQNLLQMRAAAKSSTSGLSDLEKAQLALRKANSQVNEQIQGFKLQTQAANAAAKASAKEVLGLNDAYQKLVNAEREAQREAKNLAVEQGLNSKATIDAVAKAKALNTQLQTVDQSVGQFQRNVGNYKSGFAGIGNALDKVLGPFRQAAYILPGLGLSGIFLGIAEGIGAAVVAMGLFSDKTDEASRSASILGEAFHSDDYKQATKNVEELTINIDLAKKGFLDKNEVLKQYNETLGKTIGQASSLDQAEQLLVKNGDAYIKMTLLKAAANQALDKAATAALEAEEKRNKSALEFETQATNLQSFGAGQVSAPGFVPSLNDINKGLQVRAQAAEKNRQQAIKDSEKDQKTFEDIAKKFTQDAAKIASENKFDFFGGKFDPKETKQRMSDAAKIRLDAIKEELDNEAKLYQQFAEDNRFDFGQLQTDQRIAAAQTASNARMKIIDEEAKYEKSKKDVTESEKADIDRKADEKRKQEAIKLSTDIAKIQIQQAQKTKDAVEEVNKQSDQQSQIQSRPDLLAREEVAQLQVGFDAMSRVRQANYQEELNDIQKQINAKVISEREGQKKILEVTRNNLKSSLEDQVKTTEAQMDVLLKGGLAGTKQYDELRKKLAEINAELLKIPKNTKLENLKKLADDLSRVAEIVGNFTQALSAINDIGYEKQKAQLESVENQREKNYEKEVQNINNSTLASEEKAHTIAILDAQNAAAKEQYDRRQRELDNKKAKFDRDANIANIIATTAAAVVKALATGGPFALPLAISIGALGAAQLAKAVATPVPQYAEGANWGEHPGGPAWLGDGGEHEIVQERSGRTWITPNTPTLFDLAPGAKVTPMSDALNETMYKDMLIKTGRKQQGQGGMTLEQHAKALTKAMTKNRSKTTIVIKDGSAKAQYIQKYIRS